MRRLVFLAMLAAIAIPAEAIRPVTVSELLQLLETQAAGQKSDDSIAKMVGSLDLTERLTSFTLERMEARLEPGPRTARALRLLADATLFLEPPASELLVKAPPDSATRQSMIIGAVRFAGVTLRQLPNLRATRVTRSFETRPDLLIDARSPYHVSLSMTATSSEEVSYRDGVEMPGMTPAATNAKTDPAPSVHGLVSKGEFGPMLTLTLLDAAKGTIRWTRWEETSAGLAAVFHYEVPKEISHYHVIIHSCARKLEPGRTASFDTFNGTSGYHGDLFLDPVTGAVLRFTVEPEFKKSQPIARIAVSVEYGKVEIGGNRYYCPVESVALISTRTHQSGILEERTPESLNEVSFENYHRFDSAEEVLAFVPTP